ncbi:hypothetical protein D3C81_242190 [compost metagenome]|uniref:hypothetical protein n=1 Tax=unclassified Pseudomonas TaxID=196821 RepID=UPI000FB6BA80|nr:MULTISPECIES: hypothetical protein [unclassified Pseudomonas]MDH0302259.1 hypothetical protein [Pseudomonas sp. GD04091]MDH1986010.1 hypothetical protein [Pseudomonas sp. GD03689]
MIYSKVLRVIHEQPMNEHGQEAYTVFITTHNFNLDLQPGARVLIQKFAVLWNDCVDMRIVAMIERGLIQGVLPPLKLLGVTGSFLNVVYDSSINATAYMRFEQAWREIAYNAWGDSWVANFVRETQIHDTNARDRSFCIDADGIIWGHGLGIWEFDGDRLHHFNGYRLANSQASAACDALPQSGPDLDFKFDDEPPF